MEIKLSRYQVMPSAKSSGSGTGNRNHNNNNNNNTRTTTTTTSNNSSTASAPNISYTLYLYREELRRRDARHLRLSHTKIHLTDKLISKTVRNLATCSIEDLQHINRGMLFRNALTQQIHRLHRMHSLGHSNFNPNAMSTDL